MQGSSSTALQRVNRRRSLHAWGVVLLTILVVCMLLAGLYFWRSARASENAAWQQQALPVDAIQLHPVAEAQYNRANTLTPLGAQSKDILNQRPSAYQPAVRW